MLLVVFLLSYSLRAFLEDELQEADILIDSTAPVLLEILDWAHTMEVQKGEEPTLAH